MLLVSSVIPQDTKSSVFAICSSSEFRENLHFTVFLYLLQGFLFIKFKLEEEPNLEFWGKGFLSYRRWRNATVEYDTYDKDREPFVELDPTGRYRRYDDFLGSGAMKKVYRAFDQEEGIEVAWNKVPLQNLDDASTQRIYAEVCLLKSHGNENITMLYNAWLDRKTSHVNFITEVCTSGTLREYRQKHRHVSTKALKNWSLQILGGLHYLHNHEPCVIHRHLNCSNIFVNGNSGVLKIGDLGLATTLGNVHAAHSVLGTPEFMAPELYEEDYNEVVDIYSFGMCLLEMVTL